MAQAFKAFIIIDEPISQGPVDPGYGAPPGWGLRPSQGPGFPTHPIAPGGQPPYPSQGPGFPTHPIVIPPGGSEEPGHPAHPIAPTPGHPIVIPPDAVKPGVPSHPIYLPPVISGGPGSLPPYVSHPIAPGGPYPDQGLPGPQPTPGWPPVAMPPIYIPLPPGEELPPDGSGNVPTHPIVLPPDAPVDPNGQYVLVHAYIPGYGGCWFLVNTAHVGGQPPQPGPKK
jgi:hypothetical protein